MPPLYLVPTRGQSCQFDAALPQGRAIQKNACQFGHLSANVHAGRTQAVCTSKRGSACRTTLQEHRSRGCRAPKSFCLCAWLPSWPLVQAAPRTKLSTLKSRPFRPSRPTPASTSKTKGRASWAVQAQPALFLSEGPHRAASAKFLAKQAVRFEIPAGAAYAGRPDTHFNRRFSCGPQPLSLCLPLPLLQLAPSQPPSPSRCPSLSSQRRPANTAPDPKTERARRVDRHAPVSTCRAPQHEVRPC